MFFKMFCLLQAREVEDVKKKVGIMKQLWIDGKLSVPVQITMKLLTKGNVMKTQDQFSAFPATIRR
jgi:hypothetical protein